MNDNNLEALDLITIIGFIKQLENMAGDEKYNSYIQNIILKISHEIDQLHKENDIIIDQNEEILKILKES